MKKFNITGTCIPERHYTVDISNKLDQIEKLVEEGSYFTINKPRQYGKTTTIFMLEKRLGKKNHLVISISFEGMSTKVFKDEEGFIKSFLREIKRNLKFKRETDLISILKTDEIEDISDLSYLLTDLILESNKKIILMIDEVDKSSNNQLFLDFLGMLRNKFLMAQRGVDYTFHSVILAGVHDVKNLKVKLRANEEQKYNSPWNIAVNFNIDMSFNSKEIETMLREYKDDKGIEMDIPQVAQRIYYYTSGYPYLVSKVAKVIDEDILPDKEKKKWELKDIERAVKKILEEDSVNFESLTKNLENNQKLYNLVYKIIIEGKDLIHNLYNPIINLGELYGIFKNEEGRVKVHNKIYEQAIYDYLSSKVETDLDMTPYNYRENFIKGDGYLDLKKVLRKFQLFIKEQYSDKDQEFLERNGRLIFLAFLKPIINGKGFDFKEVQVSQEKRLDVIVTYLNKKHVIELKIWRGEKYHKEGLEQLSDYLDIQGLDKGYLVSFNFNQGKEYKEKLIRKNDKEIFAVWV